MNKKSIQSLIGMEAYSIMINDIHGDMLVAPNGVKNLATKFKIKDIKHILNSDSDSSTSKDFIEYIGTITSVKFYANYTFKIMGTEDPDLRDEHNDISIILKIISPHGKIKTQFFSINNNILHDFLDMKNLIIFDGNWYSKEDDPEFFSYFLSAKPIVCNRYSGLTRPDHHCFSSENVKPFSFGFDMYIKVPFLDSKLEKKVAKQVSQKNYSLIDIQENKDILETYYFKAICLYKRQIYKFFQLLESAKYKMINYVDEMCPSDENQIDDYFLYERR